MTHACAWNQVQHGVQHAQPGTQDGHYDHITRDAVAARGPDRRLDHTVGRGQIAHGLRRQQHADPFRDAAEFLGPRKRVAQREQRVLHERVLNDLDGHGHTIHNRTEGSGG